MSPMAVVLGHERLCRVVDVWLGELRTHRVAGLDNNEGMIRVVTHADGVIKIVVDVSASRRGCRDDPGKVWP